MNKNNIILWKCLKRIIRYLKGTRNTKLIYTRNNNYTDIISGYLDANWADDKFDRKSTTD